MFELGRPINEYESHRCSGFFRRQFKRTKGVHAAFPQAECILIPLADGGEGTIEALAKATGGRVVATQAVKGSFRDASGRELGFIASSPSKHG